MKQSRFNQTSTSCQTPIDLNALAILNSPQGRLRSHRYLDFLGTGTFWIEKTDTSKVRTTRLNYWLYVQRQGLDLF